MRVVAYRFVETDLGSWLVAVGDAANAPTSRPGLLRVVLGEGGPSADRELAVERARADLKDWHSARWLQVESEKAASNPALGPDPSGPRSAVSEVAARLVERAARQLTQYAAGQRRSFDLPLDLSLGTAFQRRVWDALCAIPFGETRTYGQVAAAVGSPGAARAVGGAAGANPIPIVVPCHRVLASAGIGGFTGGLQHKRKLLTLEGIRVPGETPGQRELAFD